MGRDNKIQVATCEIHGVRQERQRNYKRSYNEVTSETTKSELCIHVTSLNITVFGIDFFFYIRCTNT